MEKLPVLTRIRDMFKPKPVFPVFMDLAGITLEIESRHAWESLKVFSVKRNLEFAEKHGVKPISFQEILSQIDEDQIGSIVLFDTPPMTFPGNHWRVAKINRKEETVELKLCGIFGNFDIKGVKSVEVPFDYPFFTGVSIQNYTVHGLPASLGEVVDAMEITYSEKTLKTEHIQHSGEIILWSNDQGVLNPRK